MINPNHLGIQLGKGVVAPLRLRGPLDHLFVLGNAGNCALSTLVCSQSTLRVNVLGPMRRLLQCALHHCAMGICCVHSLGKCGQGYQSRPLQANDLPPASAIFSHVRVPRKSPCAYLGGVRASA